MTISLIFFNLSFLLKNKTNKTGASVKKSLFLSLIYNSNLNKILKFRVPQSRFDSSDVKTALKLIIVELLKEKEEVRIILNLKNSLEVMSEKSIGMFINSLKAEFPSISVKLEEDKYFDLLKDDFLNKKISSYLTDKIKDLSILENFSILEYLNSRSESEFDSEIKNKNVSIFHKYLDSYSFSNPLFLESRYSDATTASIPFATIPFKDDIRIIDECDISNTLNSKLGSVVPVAVPVAVAVPIPVPISVSVIKNLDLKLRELKRTCVHYQEALRTENNISFKFSGKYDLNLKLIEASINNSLEKLMIMDSEDKSSLDCLYCLEEEIEFVEKRLKSLIETFSNDIEKVDFIDFFSYKEFENVRKFIGKDFSLNVETKQLQLKVVCTLCYFTGLKVGQIRELDYSKCSFLVEHGYLMVDDHTIKFVLPDLSEMVDLVSYEKKISLELMNLKSDIEKLFLISKYKYIGSSSYQREKQMSPRSFYNLVNDNLQKTIDILKEFNLLDKLKFIDYSQLLFVKMVLS